MHPVRVVGACRCSYLHGEARLATPTQASKGQQARHREQPPDLSDLSFPPNEASEMKWQVVSCHAGGYHRHFQSGYNLNTVSTLYQELGQSSTHTRWDDGFHRYRFISTPFR